MLRTLTTTFNGTHRSYELAPHTLVVGPTGSGKTTLLASLGLLLTGSADDSTGRAQVALGTELALAMRDDQDNITIKAEDTNGATATYLLDRGSKPQVSGITHDPWCHPVRHLRDLLAQNVDAARRDMAPLLLGDAPIETRRLLPVQLHDVLPQSMTLDQIQTEIENASSSIKMHKKRRDDLSGAAEALETALPMRPSIEALEGAKRAAAEHNERLVEHTRVSTEIRLLEERQNALAEQYKSLLEQYAALNKALELQQAEPQPQPQPQSQAAQGLTEEQRGNLAAYHRVLSLAVAPDQCPLCASRGVDVAALKLRIEPYLRSNPAPKPAPEPTSVPKVSPEQVNSVREQALQVYQQIADISNRRAALSTPSPAPSDNPAAVLAALQSAEQSWARAQALRGEAQAATEKLTQSTLVLAELRRLLDAAFRARIAQAEEGIKKWLPKGYGIKVLLHKGDGTKTFRLGLVRPDGTTAYNPSGGQRSALLLAMAVWLIEQDRIPKVGPMVVMLSEERGMSKDWLGKVMKALEHAPAQIVLCSLEKPTGFRGKGWSVVELTETNTEETPGPGPEPGPEVVGEA